jgi:hypothetical protein
MLPEITEEELSAALDAAVVDVLAEAGVDGPPVDAFAIARTLRITVALDDRQRGRARYVQLGGRRGHRSCATILLRPEPRAERRQWAVAHEIGEHVAHRVFAGLSVDPREAAPNTRERVAAHLAGRLLLPAAWFGPDAAAGAWDLLALKARYATASHELIARRMLDFPPPVIITIFDHGQVHFRRSNVPGRVPPPSPAERACWRTAHDENRSQELFDGPGTVRAWPVHEPGWNREIIRAEVELEPV